MENLNIFGLIPARAGNTCFAVVIWMPSGAHPRSRGEHTTLYDQWLADWGSSPLARGTPVTPGSRRRAGGLIPARAGNTSQPPRPAGPQRAHPRSRGEHSQILSNRWLRWGSSPLARGTPRPLVALFHLVGLIPARAGNTLRGNSKPPLSRAHPRSRGEHITPPVMISSLSGSSPLARGTPRH